MLCYIQLHSFIVACRCVLWVMTGPGKAFTITFPSLFPSKGNSLYMYILFPHLKDSLNCSHTMWLSLTSLCCIYSYHSWPVLCHPGSLSKVYAVFVYFVWWCLSQSGPIPHQSWSCILPLYIALQITSGSVPLKLSSSYMYIVYYSLISKSISVTTPIHVSIYNFYVCIPWLMH